ncbi:hypothetical protein MKW94_026414 [Papaver nudicaule]|uniref:Bromodomain associated domain-containing protein n=1 Tax=Papaver nudicaule TaxID=74823 RepID=A0AA41V998_PAPNU|nr:hypothetical protein [Papaver nudicaule]
MSLLGEDGLGYELAKKLEVCGVWKSWLGESNYKILLSFLSSLSTWELFMKTDDTKTRAQIQLQLRARALLFDKASVSLFLRSHPSSSPAALPSKLNPTYLQLHGDDVYFSLEDFYNNSQDGSALVTSIQSKAQPKLSSTDNNLCQRLRHDELPETWYNQFFEKYRASRQHRLPFGDRESHKRTPEAMSTYIKLLDRHKRIRKVFKEDQCVGFGNPMRENGLNLHQNSVSDGNSSGDNESSFFPEMMFPSNCVPDSALPPAKAQVDNQKVECYGVLDSLPHVMTRSPAMLERFGLRPDNLRPGLGRSKYRGKNGLEGNGKSLGQDQAFQMSQKVIARVLSNVGFEGSTEVPIEVLAQFLNCHISKLGRILKVLTDNYRKQCSALEILKMFLQTLGYSNLGALAEHVKDGTRTLPNPAVQQRVTQQGLQSQQQQIQRQMHPQMQMNSQNLSFQQQQQLQQQQLQQQQLQQQQLQQQQLQQQQLQQQQLQHQQLQQQQLQQQQLWDRTRKRQSSNPRAGMNLDRERPLVEVKIESMSESPMDVGNFPTTNPRNTQTQFRQQKIAAAMGILPAQSGHQFKSLVSLQSPQLPTQNMVTRAPPVKVEGFQDLFGGDATIKQDSEEHKLTSPSK